MNVFWNLEEFLLLLFILELCSMLTLVYMVHTSGFMSLDHNTLVGLTSMGNLSFDQEILKASLGTINFIIVSFMIFIVFSFWGCSWMALIKSMLSLDYNMTCELDSHIYLVIEHALNSCFWCNSCPNSISWRHPLSSLSSSSCSFSWTLAPLRQIEESL